MNLETKATKNLHTNLKLTKMKLNRRNKKSIKKKILNLQKNANQRNQKIEKRQLKSPTPRNITVLVNFLKSMKRHCMAEKLKETYI